MSIRQTSVGCPHYLLQLPELGKESGKAVVDFGSIGWDYKNGVNSNQPKIKQMVLTRRMLRRFNEPQGVGPNRVLVASNLLLFKAPFR